MCNLFLLSEDPAIIQAIVQTADVFGRELIAEGVEDPEHGMLLICMGCRAGQGFGISRAMAADAVLRWAEASRACSEWMRVKGLCWHPHLHKLLYHRYCLRQWQEQVGTLAQQSGRMPIPELDTVSLATWLQAHLVDTVPLARECLVLLERLRTQVASAERLEEGQRSHEMRQLLALANAVLGVLDDIAVVLGSGGQKA